MPKIVERYGRDAIDLREKSICVTLPFERLDAATQMRVPYAAGHRGQGLSENRLRILSAMRDNPNISQTKLAAILGLSRNGITKNIDWLKANGYVERVGEPRTGWWRVLK